MLNVIMMLKDKLNTHANVDTLFDKILPRTPTYRLLKKIPSISDEKE